MPQKPETTNAEYQSSQLVGIQCPKCQTFDDQSVKYTTKGRNMITRLRVCKKCGEHVNTEEKPIKLHK